MVSMFFTNLLILEVYSVLIYSFVPISRNVLNEKNRRAKENLLQPQKSKINEIDQLRMFRKTTHRIASVILTFLSYLGV